MRTADEFDTDGGSPHLLLVASSGGHLAQLLALRPWWEKHRRTWVTFDTPFVQSALEGESLVSAFHPTTRNVPNAVRNLRLAGRVMAELRPDLVVSTGAGLAAPFFLIARKLSVPSIYLEVYDRVDTSTLTGRMCRPLASAFCVQWPEQLDLYPGAELVGALM